MAGRYNRKDHLYNRAKDEGFRSRAAYKLEELQGRFKLIRKGSKVLDLGAWPGGWLQIAAKYAGTQGRLVGIDLVQIEDLPEDSIKVLRGDINDPALIEEALVFAQGSFDLVLSDLSPKLTGVREVDQGASYTLVANAYGVAQRVLVRGGNFVCKLFKGADSETFVKELRPMFNKVSRVELDSTRKSSNEFYGVFLGIK